MHIKSFTIALVLLSAAGTRAQNGPETAIRGVKQFRRSVVVSGLAGPWEMTWGPDGKLWVTERTGKRVVRVDPATGERTTAIEIAEVSAPGGQDGLLGMALHPELLKGTGNDFVWVAYTYADRSRGPVAAIAETNSPYRYLYGKVVRLSYNAKTGKLSDPVTIFAGFPAGNDHNAGRLKIGPDRKLYLTIGDRGHNQLGNFCQPIEAQRLPTRQELQAKDYVSYVGKSLRMNLDGSVPEDNPAIGGVRSHVFTYGHRNPQGLDFGPDGTLYSSEQGPKTDDEVNVLKAGANYGWPHVAGMKDNKAYEFARWAEAGTPCAQLKFSDLAIDPSVPREPESAFTKPFEEPLATLFTVPTGYKFNSPACKGVDFICWPTVGASSVEYYESKGTGVAGWDKVLLVTALKRGSLYVVPLRPDGKSAAGYISRFFQSENRYRDTAVSPDRKTIYIATDPGGLAEGSDGGVIRRMQDPGAILAFTYVGEGGSATEEAAPVSEAKPAAASAPRQIVAGAIAPQFTAAQTAAGKTAYNSNCAVCHGSTMTNGTFGVPLAGEYFRNAWNGRTVRALYDRSHKTMPPSAPGSLTEETYANIVAYILETNGMKARGARLAAGNELLDKMTIR